MLDYKAVKDYWTRFFKDWQEDVKESQKEILKFWSDFLKK